MNSFINYKNKLIQITFCLGLLFAFNIAHSELSYNFGFYLNFLPYHHSPQILPHYPNSPQILPHYQNYHHVNLKSLSCNNASSITQCVRRSFNYHDIQSCFNIYGSNQDQIFKRVHYRSYGVNLRTISWLETIWANYYAQIDLCSYNWAASNVWCVENATRNFELENSKICY